MEDRVLLAIAFLSLLISLISIIYTAKSARAARKAADLNLKMYTEQKREQEKMYLPHFETGGYMDKQRNYVIISLANKNNYPISDLKIRMVEPVLSEAAWTGPSIDEQIFVTLNHDFKNVDRFVIELEYSAVTESRYTTTIEFQEKDYMILSKLIRTQAVQKSPPIGVKKYRQE